MSSVRSRPVAPNLFFASLVIMAACLFRKQMASVRFWQEAPIWLNNYGETTRNPKGLWRRWEVVSSINLVSSVAEQTIDKGQTLANPTRVYAPLDKWEVGSLQNYYELVRFQHGAPISIWICSLTFTDVAMRKQNVPAEEWKETGTDTATLSRSSWKAVLLRIHG